MPSTQATKSPRSKKAPPVASPPTAEAQATPPPKATTSDTGTREAFIRIAAYAFYERRGFVSGHELEDWLQAEIEVDRQLAEAAGAKPAK